MKVYLLKDIERVGLAGEVIKVKPGFANNFLFPQKLALEVSSHNEAFYSKKAKEIENRKEVINCKTSMLAEKIKDLKLSIKKKVHNDDKLYASVSAAEISELLSGEGIKVNKSQVLIKKSIKTPGAHKITIKLSNQLKPELNLKVVADRTK